MNKRSAIVVAAAVVAAMLSGTIWLSASDGPAVAEASTKTAKPHVRTVHRTITVHRTASPAAPVVVTAPAASAPTTTHGTDETRGDDGSAELEGGSEDAQSSFSNDGQGEPGDD